MKLLHYVAAATLITLAACSHENSRSRDFKVNENQSVIDWKGMAPTHFHIGTFNVSGVLETDKQGAITGGHFTIPIASITDTDLPDSLKIALLTHLKSPDFFNIALFPEASFRISSVTYDRSPKSDSNQVTIAGDFSMIGQTHPLRFPATIKAGGDYIQTRAAFKLNRLEWGMQSYNHPDSALYILPEVEIKLNIQSQRM
ncbi:YceI family protein [Chitinophaga arvensicola]|uniref:YceI-like domain-containing protein n=1 Tax=Chitinophaga arvensicola TaxID=29529 RepID=A0A1I0S7S0_9BACT|nr:YceI family protein [Chitinophaga arvensicola]SEW51838.1 YceI-like domain-containing protein [Chitinophaga arvensicola]